MGKSYSRPVILLSAVLGLVISGVFYYKFVWVENTSEMAGIISQLPTEVPEGQRVPPRDFSESIQRNTDERFSDPIFSDFTDEIVGRLWFEVTSNYPIEDRQESFESLKTGLSVLLERGENVGVIRQFQYIAIDEEEFGFSEYLFPFEQGMLRVLFLIGPSELERRAHMFIVLESEGGNRIWDYEIDSAPQDYVMGSGENSFLFHGILLDSYMYTLDETSTLFGFTLGDETLEPLSLSDNLIGESAGTFGVSHHFRDGFFYKEITEGLVPTRLQWNELFMVVSEGQIRRQ